MPWSSWAKMPNFGAGAGGQRELLFDAARRHVAEPVERRASRPDLPPAGSTAGGRGKRADVQPIDAAAVAGEGAFADLDDVRAVLGADDRGDAVLPHQRRVVGRASSNRLRVEDGHVRIEERIAQPQAFDLGRDPLALLGLDDEVVDVLVVAPRR